MADREETGRTGGARSGVPGRLLALYLLLGFAAGLPFYMFNAVLLLRLAKHGVDIVTVGYFGWVALLPTFKFAWAPLLDKFDVPGFARFWGRRRGWIMLAQVGIFLSTVAMAFTASDANLELTALFAVTLAFWTTTLEVAADGWRIELAPTAAEQGPIVAANLWGYRSAMVAAGSGAIWIAAKSDWTIAYLAIAAAAFLPFPILALTRREADGAGGRAGALVTGTGFSLVILALTTAVAAAVGWVLFATVGAAASGKSRRVQVLGIRGGAVALRRARRGGAVDPALAPRPPPADALGAGALRQCRVAVRTVR